MAENNLLNRHATIVSEGFRKLKELEDNLSFMRDSGRPTHQLEDSIRDSKAQLKKDAAALEKRGIAVDYHGVSV